MRELFDKSTKSKGMTPSKIIRRRSARTLMVWIQELIKEALRTSGPTNKNAREIMVRRLKVTPTIMETTKKMKRRAPPKGILHVTRTIMQINVPTSSTPISNHDLH